MKKTYITPEMEVVEIEKKVQLLAGSVESFDLIDDPTVDPTPGGTLAPALPGFTDITGFPF